MGMQLFGWAGASCGPGGPCSCWVLLRLHCCIRAGLQDNSLCRLHATMLINIQCACSALRAALHRAYCQHLCRPCAWGPSRGSWPHMRQPSTHKMPGLDSSRPCSAQHRGVWQSWQAGAPPALQILQR